MTEGEHQPASMLRFVQPQTRVAWGLPTLVIFLGLASTFGPIFARGPHHMPGGLGDTRLVHFSLEHAHRYFLQVDGHQRFWDPPLFYPAQGTAAFTDTTVSLVPFYSPWRWLGAAPETAFQLWWLSVFGLNFIAFFLYLRRVFGLSSLAASAGSYLFAFGSVRLVDLGHPQMMPWFYVVAALFALHRLWQALVHRDRPIAPWVALLCAAMTLQAYGAVYPLFFLVLGVACWAVPALIGSLTHNTSRQRITTALRQIIRRRPTLRSTAWWLVAAFAVLAILPLAHQYLEIRQNLGERPWSGIEPRIPRLSSWILMGSGSRLYGSLADAKAETRLGWHPRNSNHNNGLGFLTLGTVVLGFIVAKRPRRDIIPWFIGSALLVLLTTVYPGGFTPWRWIYEHLPGAGAIRAVGRVGMTLLIPAGLGFALLLDRLGQYRWLRWGAPLLLGLMAMEQLHVLPSFDGRIEYSRTARLATHLPADCKTFLVTPTTPGKHRAVQEDAMWMAIHSGLPTINGRYGNHPPGWHLMEIASRQGLPATEIEQRLDAWIEARNLDRGSVCWLESDGSSLHRRQDAIADPR